MQTVRFTILLVVLLAGVLSAAPDAPPAQGNESAYNERVTAHVITGYDLLLRGETRAALDTIARAMALDPQSVFLKVLYAEVLFQLGRHEELIKILKPILDGGGSPPDQAARMMAVSCQALGRVDEAIGWYRRVIERDPQEEWARRRLLELLNDRGRYQEMIPVYKYLLDPESENFAFDSFQMGALYMRIGGREPAREHLNRALAADSSLAESHKLLAGLDELELKFNTALEHYMRYLELRPDDAQEVMPQVVGLALRAAYPAFSGTDSVDGENAWNTLIDRLESRIADGDSLNPVLQRVRAIAYEATGQTERAQELYVGILDRDPGDRFIRRSLIRVMFSRGMYAQMIPLYAPLLGNRQDSDAYARDLFQLSALHLRVGEPDQARKYLIRAIEVDSAFADPYRVLGNICENAGEWDAAGRYYLDYIDLQPEAVVETFDRLLTVSLRNGDLQAPTVFFEDLIAAGDTNAATREMLGRLYYHDGLFEDAADLLLPLDADNALSDNGLYTLGFLHARMENHSEAVSAFEKVRERMPEFAPVYISLSRIYYSMQRFDKALEALQQGLLRVRDDDREGRRELIFSMANVYHEMGDDANTVKYLRQVLEENPDYAPALNYLGYFFAERGENLEEARSLIDRALKEDPGNGHYIDSKGWVLFKLGYKEEALKEIRNALAAIGDHPEIYEHLGDIYHSMGDRNKALEAWGKSLEMDSENAELRSKLEKLKNTEPGAAGGEK